LLQQNKLLPLSRR